MQLYSFLTNSKFLIIVFITIIKINFIRCESKIPNCTCVAFFQCTEIENGVIITDGDGLIQERTLKTTPCPGYFDICCQKPKLLETSTQLLPKKLTGCGYKNENFFPWLGILFFQELAEFPPSYKCGVSLIHPNVVITAAHCLNQKGIWSVKMGSLTRSVSKIIIHPSYKPSSLRNDIAIIIVNESFDISDNINPVCIPPIGTILDSTECIAMTWTTNNYNNTINNYLKMIKLPIIPRDNCVNMLRTTRLGKFFQLHHSFLCAGGQDETDTCDGDGGSPLVCPVPGQPGRYHQAGIVSWGIGCGGNDVPGIYVKLSVFRDWIDKEMRRNYLDISSYRY